ncbi:MAG: electron transport complex subunit RsxC, partial [Fusobacteriaceae bacterium]
FGFKGGVHPADNKSQTENMQTEKISIPKMLYIPLIQHIGTPLDPIVTVGEKVLKGQKIGDSKAFLTSPIHSSTSGIVKKIDNYDFPLMGKTRTIFIETDGEETWCELHPIKNWETATREELLEKIRESGIVGIGGASFPTHIKLNPPADAKIDTLLLNAAECEPYLNSDNRLLIENTEKVISGIKILKKILSVENVVIGIEDNKKEAIGKLEIALKGTGIELVVLKTLYPQGGEKQLIKAALGREVPSGKLPLNVGVVVQNTGTAAAVFSAIVEGKPLIEKVVTVSGLAVENPKNLIALIGTPISHLLDICGSKNEEIDRLIMGGPMMGMAQYTSDVPVIKGSSGVLALTKKETNTCKARPCIGCGKCVDACPMGLMPIMYARLGEFNIWEEFKIYNIMDCIECGSCAYICPSNRPLTESIKLGKAKVRMMK